MKITITKKNGRSQLFCTRKDGSTTYSNVGPTVPFHDMAHLVAEKQLGLKHGFYGNIANGYSIEQLSDSNTIRTLGNESWIAEIVTRALQSLYSGACTPHDFFPMIKQELDHLSIPSDGLEKRADAVAMLEHYTALVEKWKEVRDGESLEMEF